MLPQSMIRPSKFATKTADHIGVVLTPETCFRELSVLNVGQHTAILSFCSFAHFLHSNSVSVHGLVQD